ncbi:MULTISPECIES: ParA family protein [Mycobacterium avium complex (MAC)]|uniref:ATPase involved in chromosome partitioning n=4 Tax=Mycobacterium avium complex (MAC) TaxID=120793 RepID=A0A220YL58_MYCIT|nr:MULTISPECIES: ParA family protein [Mycobacterium avium complex (MAC)]MCH2218793.1 ParA family protein [Dechloromonas sp.]PJE18833.1 MAG: chromosome partitioning protein ParA [Mycobacterium sp.]AOS95151.1 chromosome partitioning protein ParA [Mycobacterium intracellulare subsp. chimaera]ASL18480.1 ATPase involved in chromosome partitioning [Mycobacterium intracellulare subsp. chimaera]ASL24352.1 ATPase involved in chromosome partitioning [Mycobacterium intracellulare subsp. chimaera]
MPIISLVHTKGGVAKTTTAVYLATAAHRRGIDVVLIDADPQGSALEWAADARSDDPLPFPVVAAGRPLRADCDQEVTIVDTPPGTAQVIQEAIDIADLVVVPTGASPLDVRRVWPTLEITAHRPTAVLLTAVDLRTRLADEVRVLLEGEGVPVIGTPIVRREGIRRAYGITPGPLHGYDDVLTELIGAVVGV